MRPENIKQRLCGGRTSSVAALANSILGVFYGLQCAADGTRPYATSIDAPAIDGRSVLSRTVSLMPLRSRIDIRLASLTSQIPR